MKITSRVAALALAAGLLAVPAALFAQGPPPPPGYGQGYGQGPRGWDAPPNRYRRDVEQNAFRDGITGASKDLQNRRRPDVNNRDEYRNYRGPDARAYRNAFRDGYRAFWDHQGPGRRY